MPVYLGCCCPTVFCCLSPLRGPACASRSREHTSLQCQKAGLLPSGCASNLGGRRGERSPQRSAAVPACQQTLRPPPFRPTTPAGPAFPWTPQFPFLLVHCPPPGPAIPWSILQHSFLFLQNSVVFLRTRHLARLPQDAQSRVMSAGPSSPWTVKSRLSGSRQCWPQW